MKWRHLLLVNASKSAVERTPADRDRVIDLVRAFSINVVVFGHLLMALVKWTPDGEPLLGNLLASNRYLQLLTWPLQVMPLFFVAGGAAAAISYRSAVRRREPYRVWVWNRMRRLVAPGVLYLMLLPPLAVFVKWAVSAPTALALLVFGTQLLWFLSIYVLVTGMTPWLLRLHDRYGWNAILGWLLLTALMDLARFKTGIDALGLVNFIAVWAMAAQLGMIYQDRLAATWTPAQRAGVAFAASVLLVFFGPYPLSLVGMPGEALSNMAPPSVVLAFHTITLAALLDLARDRLARLAARPAVWRWTVQANMAAMTIYLWHLPVIVTVTALAHQLGFDRPVQQVDGVLMPGDGYWPQSLVFWSIAVVVLLAAVQVLWLLEQTELPLFGPTQTQTPSRLGNAFAISGVVLAGVALLLIAAVGLAYFPNSVLNAGGLEWTNGEAIALFVMGLAALRISVAVGR